MYSKKPKGTLGHTFIRARVGDLWKGLEDNAVSAVDTFTAFKRKLVKLGN